MIYGSVCSGIEAASVAWHPLGWRPAFFSEIEAFPRAVLKHHYPDVPLHGDFTTIREGQYAAIDVLVGGTPCQSFSVAGLRGGLADERGNLALEYLRLAQRLRPEWLVWENVPGVLSSEGGRDFGAIIGGMVELGYCPAWRVLDAQYVRVDGFSRAVPQRRRRVFVVGHLGDWRRAAAVLFERESLQGHPAPGRQAGQRPSPTLSARPSGGGGLGTDFDLDGGLVAKTLVSGGHSNNPLDENLVVPLMASGCEGANGAGIGEPGDPAMTLDTSGSMAVAHALRADGFDASEDGTGRGTPLIPIDLRQASRGEKITNNREHGSGGAPGHGIGNVGDPAFTVSERGQAIAYDILGVPATQGAVETSVHVPLRARQPGQSEASTTTVISAGWRVRRLTPTECERLQGFPDGYTAISYRGKPAADGPRYKALGNSMAVNVMRWIGRRIEAVAARTQALEAAE